MNDNIVLDTNIIISILIKPSGKISSLFEILQEKKKLFISDFTLQEIITHSSKIQRIAKYSVNELEQLLHVLLSSVSIIYKEIIPEKFVVDAVKLCEDVDIKDTPFVAVALMLDAILWTGDKKLITALKAKGFSNICNSEEIETLLQL